MNKQKNMDQSNNEAEALDFLARHEAGVLSSIDNAGNVTGSVIYYTIVNKCAYFITKSGTHKATSLIDHHQVALTIFDEAKLQTVQCCPRDG